jgi:DNA-binding beta-propeller fold protein YncE
MLRGAIFLMLLLSMAVAPRVQAQQPYVHDQTVSGLVDPLAVGFDKDGSLLIAAGREGLIRVDRQGGRTVVSSARVDRLPGATPVSVDTARNRVIVRTDAQVSVIDGSDWAIGRLGVPEAAALAPDGSVWIADTGNARVVRVDRDGGARAFGERGFFPGQFIAPSGVAFDAGGPLVSDRLNHRVTRLAWDGSLRDVFGLHALRPREGEGRIHYPTAIAVDAGSGRVAVAEPFERRVQVFRPRAEGEKPKPMPPMPSKEGVSSHFGPDCSVGGDIVAAWEPESGCVVLWDARNDPPAHVNTFGGTGERPGLFRAPVSVLVEPDGGAVWVLDRLGDRLERWLITRDHDGPVDFDPFMTRLYAGIPLSEVRTEASIGSARATDLIWRNGRAGVVFDDGSVAWTDPALQAFQRDASRARPRSGSSALRAAAVDPDGELLLLWEDGIEVRGDGDPVFVPLTRVARDPRGVVAANDGFVVSDADRDALVRVNRAGELVGAVVAPRADALRFDGAEAAKDGALWLPGRLAGGGEGPVWVVDYGNHRLQRFGADGAWQSTFTLSKSRAKDPTPPTKAPSAQEVARAAERRDAARALARTGTGTLALPGGGMLHWRAPNPIPLAEPFALEVTATAPDGSPLKDGMLLVDCTMPHHGHGMNVRPVVKQLVPGSWRAEPMLLHMPGRWELSFDIALPDGRVRRSQCTLEIE